MQRVNFTGYCVDDRFAKRADRGAKFLNNNNNKVEPWDGANENSCVGKRPTQCPMWLITQL
jgi:hypothetical protein